MYNFARMGLTEHRAPKGEATALICAVTLLEIPIWKLHVLRRVPIEWWGPAANKRAHCACLANKLLGGGEEGTGSIKGSQECFVSAESNDQDV
jgi:hypothetical protein